ncbi:MAG: peptidoglycan editing factor PgeF [Endomicrobiales bacterium]
MNKHLADGLFRDESFPFYNVVTTSSLGNMRDPVTRRAFCRAQGIDFERVVTAEQVHGNKVAVVDGSISAVAGVDGLITRGDGLSLAIFTADCLSIFFGAPGDGAAGVIHAGWRGLAKGIIPETVKKFRQELAVEAESLVALIGPHIRKCCYRVSDDLKDVFGLPRREETLDLAAIALGQLHAAGITRVSVNGHCTAHEDGLFFSFRRDKTAHRIMSLVRLNGR